MHNRIYACIVRSFVCTLARQIYFRLHAAGVLSIDSTRSNFMVVVLVLYSPEREAFAL